MFPRAKFLHILFCTPSGHILTTLKYLVYILNTSDLYKRTDQPTDQRTTWIIEYIVDPKKKISYEQISLSSCILSLPQVMAKQKKNRKSRRHIERFVQDKQDYILEGLKLVKLLNKINDKYL